MIAPSSTRAFGDTQAVPGASGERRGAVAAVHDVAMHLHVLLRRADVDPVAAIDVGDERLARAR